jgi:hypothetical protein
MFQDVFLINTLLPQKYKLCSKQTNFLYLKQNIYFKNKLKMLYFAVYPLSILHFFNKKRLTIGLIVKRLCFRGTTQYIHPFSPNFLLKGSNNKESDCRCVKYLYIQLIKTINLFLNPMSKNKCKVIQINHAKKP